MYYNKNRVTDTYLRCCPPNRDFPGSCSVIGIFSQVPGQTKIGNMHWDEEWHIMLWFAFEGVGGTEEEDYSVAIEHT